MTGVFWGTAAVLGYAFYQIMNRRLVQQAPVYRTTFMALLGSSAVGLVVLPLWVEAVAWQQLTLAAIAWFSLSGVVHFSLGWTLLSLAQRRIGAARTSPLTSSMVVLAAAFGALFFGEPFNVTLVAGMALTVLGVYLISQQGRGAAARGSAVWQGIALALVAGTSWAVSPVFFRWGYALTPSPFIAAEVGLIAGAVSSGAIWLALRRIEPGIVASVDVPPLDSRRFWLLQSLAGVVVGAAIFMRWVALAHLPMVAVNSLAVLAVPLVVFLAPLLLGHKLEQSSWRLWLGTACILGGVALTTMGGI